MSTLAEAIDAVYRQVDAPRWAARNLDALADVLRDLSWLPAGVVEVRVPSGADTERVRAVLRAVAAETSDRTRPVRLIER